MSNRYIPPELESIVNSYNNNPMNMMQQTSAPANLNVKKVQMSEVRRSISNQDAVDQVSGIAENVRKNINNLILFNNTLCSAKHLDLDYTDQSKKYESILEKINKLERNAPHEDAAIVREHLEQIADQIELEISNTNYIFPKIIYSSIHIHNFVQNVYSQIGHTEYKQEANVALSSMAAIEKFLELDKLNDKEGVTIDRAIRTISLLNEMAEYKHEILGLKKLDQLKSQQTTKMVLGTMFFILLAMIAAIVTVSLVGVSWANSKEYMLPVVGVPLAVIIWGFIGSFASMLYRFNRRPIHDFGHTVKWLITRPVQGVVLSSAFYLVLISGQFLFTGEVKTDGEGVLNSTEIILFLSFLLGFSDRFGDSVFEMLVQKYAGGDANPITQPPIVIPPTVIHSNTGANNTENINTDTNLIDDSTPRNLNHTDVDKPSG
ncbi:MAG: hypothetical protein GY810_24495 [Aureispira sp.]|nr:hypothetical protein [Aureispira sp.]